MLLNIVGGTNMNRNSSFAWSKICGHGQCIAQQSDTVVESLMGDMGAKAKVTITLVRELESKEIKEVIRRMFVMQMKINCITVLVNDFEIMRVPKIG